MSYQTLLPPMLWYIFLYTDYRSRFSLKHLRVTLKYKRPKSTCVKPMFWREQALPTPFPHIDMLLSSTPDNSKINTEGSLIIKCLPHQAYFMVYCWLFFLDCGYYKLLYCWYFLLTSILKILNYVAGTHFWRYDFSVSEACLFVEMTS